MNQTAHALDDLDLNIINALSKDAQQPFNSLAERFGVSAGTVHQRFTKLKKAGIVLGSRIIIDPEKVGLKVSAFISVNLYNQRDYARVMEGLKKIPQVCEAYSVTGQIGILTKVNARSIAGLRAIIQAYQRIKEISSTSTMVILDSSFNRSITTESITDVSETEE